MSYINRDYLIQSLIDFKTTILDKSFLSKDAVWTGTKSEFEALDKSTLKDGQQIIITDD